MSNSHLTEESTVKLDRNKELFASLTLIMLFSAVGTAIATVIFLAVSQWAAVPDSLLR